MNPEVAKSIDVCARLVATCDRLLQITDAGHEIFISQFTMQWAAQHGIVRLGLALHDQASSVGCRPPCIKSS